MTNLNFKLLSLMSFFVLGNGAFAGQHLESGVQQNTLIELFTSEGCSSCPPAEHALNTYRHDPELWNTFIPVAFHVDYWDYIGWKDRFARPDYGSRQRDYARLQQNRTVYTPAFFVNGQSWRPGWFGSSHPQTSQLQVGNLVLQLEPDYIQASFIPATKSARRYRLNLSILGMGLSSEITAGENEGRKSQHEFVVLHHQVSEPGQTWRLPWPDISASGAKEFALAAWVSTEENPIPLQATGTLLPAKLFTKFK